MIGGAVALLLLAAVPGVPSADARSRNDAIFDYSRARNFRALAMARRCEAAEPARTRELIARHDAALVKLFAMFGAAEFDSRLEPPEPAGRDCGGTLLGYEDKIVALEMRVGKGN